MLHLNKEGLTKDEIIEAYESMLNEYDCLMGEVDDAALKLSIVNDITTSKMVGNVLRNASAICTMDIECIKARYESVTSYRRDISTDINQEAA